MDVVLPAFRAPVLPWSGQTQDERRFRRILQRVLLVCALVCLVMPWLPVPKIDRDNPPALPPPMAKLLLDRPIPPPPPPVPAVANRTETRPEQATPKVTPPPPTKRPEPTRLQPPPPPPPNKAAPVPEARQPVPDQAPGEKLAAARRKAAGVGLLANAEDLAELRGAPLAAQLKDIKQGPGVGTGVGPGVGAGNAPGVPARSLITSNATQGSGGINTAGLSRDTGGGGLAGRATTLVEGAAGGGGGGGPGGGGRAGASGPGGPGGAGGPGGSVQRGASGKAARSIEDLKLVFDRNKGSIYAIYNRALREDPGLHGRVVVELKIAPSGAVLECHIVSSELNSPDIENKLLARIRQFDFGAKDVDQLITSWPLDFLPS